MLRYGVSIAVAILLILAGVAYVRQVERSFERQVRQRLREAKAAGKLPPGIDPDSPNLPAVGVPLTAPEMRRIEFAHLLVAWRYALIPLILLGGLAVARGLKRSGL